MLDGELVILDAAGRQDFDALQQRIHPAVSRIERLAKETPARFVAFDLLARDGKSLLEEPFERRRELLEDSPGAGRLTPSTRDPGDRSRGCGEPRAVQAARRAIPARRANRAW